LPTSGRPKTDRIRLMAASPASTDLCRRAVTHRSVFSSPWQGRDREEPLAHTTGTARTDGGRPGYRRGVLGVAPPPVGRRRERIFRGMQALILRDPALGGGLGGKSGRGLGQGARPDDFDREGVVFAVDDLIGCFRHQS